MVRAVCTLRRAPTARTEGVWRTRCCNCRRRELQPLLAKASCQPWPSWGGDTTTTERETREMAVVGGGQVGRHSLLQRGGGILASRWCSPAAAAWGPVCIEEERRRNLTIDTVLIGGLALDRPNIGPVRRRLILAFGKTINRRFTTNQLSLSFVSIADYSFDETYAEWVASK